MSSNICRSGLRPHNLPIHQSRAAMPHFARPGGGLDPSCPALSMRAPAHDGSNPPLAERSEAKRP